jgi:ketosteroid isomerase-like protein
VQWRTTPDAVAAWVAGYEAAWRSPGTHALADLFIEDATYQPAPFSDPWRGLGEIAAMWEAERDGPDEPFTLTWELVAASGARAVVRVEVHYDPPRGQLYRDLWVLHFAADGRCAAFEEWPFWPPGTPGGPAAGRQSDSE